MSVFNGAAYVGEAVESILKQSFRDFEFLVINDGSRDGSPEILDGFQQADARIRVIHQDNQGLIASLNRGCAQARGTYIARMDADDVAVPERLALQVAFLGAHPEVAVLGGVVESIDGSGRSLGYRRYPVDSLEIRTELLDSNVVWHPTVMIRRDAYEAVGGFRNVPAAEDYDLWLRIADRAQIANLPNVLLKYRIHDSQITAKQNSQMALSALSSRGSAFARRSGVKDPLDSTQPSVAALAEMARSVKPFTAAELAGVRTEEQVSRWKSYLRWIQQAADVSDEVCQAATAGLNSPFWKAADRREVADLRYTSARLYWKEGRHLHSAAAACQALFRQPTILGRALKPLLRVVRGETSSADAWRTELS
jgi:glycosyltransferase involved in cell wall biosynthesis